MISELLRAFIAKAETHVVGEPPYGSSKDIIVEWLGSTNFLGLQVKASFGQGRATAVPWIGFFGYGQKTEEGIYPVFLYFKEQERLVLAYGLSENNPPDRLWSGIEGRETIREYFVAHELGTPARYGSSIVHSVYETNSEFDEAEIQQDLTAVVERFKAIFENDASQPTEDSGILNPSIIAAINSTEIQTLLAEVDFYFEKGRQMLRTFEALSTSPEFLNQLLLDYEAGPDKFNEKLALFPSDSESHKLLTILGKLISYCDHNAANKNTYNEYDDKRILARANVRQGDWVKNLIKYKLDNNQTRGISDSIGNAISYLKNPMSGLTMLSENHREMVSKNLLRQTTYNREAFVDDVLGYFKPYPITPINPENLTRIISNILYHFDDVKSLWFEESSGNRPDPSVQLHGDGPDLDSIDFSSKVYGDTHRAILTAIKTKPFVLLAGLSGTGKSRLVRTLAYMTCFDPRLQSDHSKPGNFELIAVKPNWHDSGELMGYVSRINGEKYLTTAFLKFVAKAWKFLNVPFFLCLDEMNLAPVEQYFAEYLSIVETRATRDGQVKSDYLLAKLQFENPELYPQLLRDLGLVGETVFAEGISIPPNLIVVGTVNMDETTHSFSRKVLDRAMTFEMNIVDLSSGLGDGKSDWSYPETFVPIDDVVGDFSAGSEVVNLYPESQEVIDYLIRLNEILDGTPFKVAYRVRDEFLIYCYYSSLFEDRPDNWLETALDEMTAMKVLSRIEGDEPKTAQVLTEFGGILNENFPITTAKLDEMRKRLQISGYTSFWS